jgi:hypothetical protein
LLHQVDFFAYISIPLNMVIHFCPAVTALPKSRRSNAEWNMFLYRRMVQYSFPISKKLKVVTVNQDMMLDLQDFLNTLFKKTVKNGNKLFTES